MNDIFKINSISEFSELTGQPSPKHPLIQLYEDKDFQNNREEINEKYSGIKMTSEMYFIMFKDNISGSLSYGRQSYDFQNGTLVFISPNQIVQSESENKNENSKGWYLAFHPDLLRGTSLSSKMSSYSFFLYENNEALHLSEDEQEYILSIANTIKKEYSQNMDTHSQQLIISNLELLLNNCLRYYDRQFYTRTNFNKDFIVQFENLLHQYINSDLAENKGIPNVSYFAQEIGMSSNYLSDLLKKETGKSAKSHINKAIIEKTKDKLLSTNNSIGEIAYSLGFEHPQSLARLFKSKTGISPIEYRNSN